VDSDKMEQDVRESKLFLSSASLNILGFTGKTGNYELFLNLINGFLRRKRELHKRNDYYDS
jgi:hypothetical protein